MEANRIFTAKEKIDLDIEEITLLSKEEASVLPAKQRNLGLFWWLRSASIINNTEYADCVDDEGVLWMRHVGITNGVAPALRISNLHQFGLNIGDSIEVGGESWVIISSELAWCDHLIGETAFQTDYLAPDANGYERSNAKKWLDQWALERGIVTQENIALFQTR